MVSSLVADILRAAHASSAVRPATPLSATLDGVSTNNVLTAAETAIDWLEQVAADWGRLDTLSAQDRQRLHRAIAALSTADPAANRRRRKAARAERVLHKQAVLDETGIRAHRRRVLVTTPYAPPPCWRSLKTDQEFGVLLAEN